MVLMQNTFHYFLYCHKVGHAWSHIKLGFTACNMILEWNKVQMYLKTLLTYFEYKTNQRAKNENNFFLS